MIGTQRKIRWRRRDWSWAWSPTVGPVVFSIHLAPLRPDLVAYFHEVAGRAYSVMNARGFETGGGDRDPEVVILDHQVKFLRSYHEPSREVVNADQRFLSGVIRGELGAAAWDLFDGDYYSFEAAGESRDSLAEYLDARVDENSLRERYRAQCQPVSLEVDGASDVDHIAGCLADRLEAPVDGAPAIDRLIDWLQKAPAGKLPRNVTVPLLRTLNGDPAFAGLSSRVVNANHRMLWRWSFCEDPR